jgi:alpha-galactosidase
MSMKSLLFGLLLCLASTLGAKEMVLTGIEPGKIKVGWGEAKINASITGQRATVAGQHYVNALGVHPAGYLVFQLDGKATRFHCLVGIDDDTKGKGSAELLVYGDNFKLLGRSGKLLPGQPAQDFRAKLDGQKILILQFSDAGDGNAEDHLDLIIPSISYEGEKPVVLDQLPVDRTPYVLTPPAPFSPRLNPPRVFGVRPGSPFLFRIPASGKAPLQFSASGLPPGLSLDPASGVISGKITDLGKKTWTVKLAAENRQGKDSNTLRIVVGDRIALTPPMGWNSWYVWSESVNEKHLRQAADAFVRSGLANYGWSYLNLDDCWQGERTGPGQALAANEKFPDIKGTVDYIHSFGLKAGIYSTPWIGSYAGFRGGSCTNPEGTYEGLAASERLQPGQIFGRYPGHKKFKAAQTGPNWFFTADMKQIAGWGFDFIKVDWNPNDVPTTERISRDVRGQPRDIVLSLSNAATLGSAADYARLAELWRTTGDIHDAWSSISGIGFSQQRWVPFSGPGHWNDPDMLQIGFTNTPNQLVANSRPSRLTPSEQYSQVTLWSLLAAPLILSCDLEKLDPFTINLITNPEVIAVNQDPLGRAAIELCASHNLRIFCKTLEDGALAIGLFNTDDVFPVQTNFDLASLQLPHGVKIRDLWRQKDLAVNKGRVAIDIPPHGCLLLRASGKSPMPALCQATGYVAKLETGGWATRFNEKLAEAKTGDCDIVWIGDSITHGWDIPENQHILKQYFGQWKSLNLGISGDRTENVLWRLRNGALDGLHPKVAVLMIGTNNTDGEHFPRADSAEELAAGQLAILDLLRDKLPGTRILFLKVFPYGEQDNPRRQANFKASELTASRIAGDPKIRYLDLTSVLMPDGKTLAKTNMPDFLHPNSFGYWQWAAAIAPAIHDAIDDRPADSTLVRRLAIPWRQVKVAGASSAENSGGWRAAYHPAVLANDGDPRTIWHTQITPAAIGPQWLTLDLGRAIPVGGIALLTRPDVGPGTILRARIYVSDVLEKRGNPAFDGCLPPALPGQTQTVAFPAKSGQFVTIEAIAGATAGQAAVAIAEATVLSTGPLFELASPLENQVFQRGPDNRAKVCFAGIAPIGATRITLAFSGKPHPAAGPLPARAEFPVDPKTGVFAGELFLPAGGWYGVELQATKPAWLGTKCLGKLAIGKFGVGEVFATAGQSNSTCCGDTRTQSETGMVTAFSGRHWVPANDPLPGSADQYVYRGGSFWPSFGDAIARRFGVPVGIAMTGYGGTSTTQWQPEASTGYFAGMAERLRQLGPNGCRCLLWHQGESDTGNKSPTAQQGYYDRMKKIIDSSREKAGWPIPWSVARATFRPKAGNDEPVRNAQKQLWDDGIALPGPDTDAIPSELRDNGGNGIHFSPKGLNTIGQAWAELASPLIEAAITKK